MYCVCIYIYICTLYSGKIHQNHEPEKFGYKLGEFSTRDVVLKAMSFFSVSSPRCRHLEATKPGRWGQVGSSWHQWLGTIYIYIYRMALLYIHIYIYIIIYICIYTVFNRHCMGWKQWLGIKIVRPWRLILQLLRYGGNLNMAGKSPSDQWRFIAGNFFCKVVDFHSLPRLISWGYSHLL